MIPVQLQKCEKFFLCICLLNRIFYLWYLFLFSLIQKVWIITLRNAHISAAQKGCIFIKEKLNQLPQCSKLLFHHKCKLLRASEQITKSLDKVQFGNSFRNPVRKTMKGCVINGKEKQNSLHICNEKSVNSNGRWKLQLYSMNKQQCLLQLLYCLWYQVEKKKIQI